LGAWDWKGRIGNVRAIASCKPPPSAGLGQFSEQIGARAATIRSLPMQIPFDDRGLTGEVNVTVEAVQDAAAVGSPAGTEGFPCCEAIVGCTGQGYDAMFGWVQLVRSEDWGDGTFAIDLSPHFADVPSPYIYYGLRPILFDAPSREKRDPLDWIAHSFLAPLGIFAEAREVRPLLGFSWGFDIDGAGQITVKPVECLTSGDWAEHLLYLGGQYPAWSFVTWPGAR
jgi:hypothetical protein